MFARTDTDFAALEHLHGALGKTSGRAYKTAPRQLLQVDASAPANSASSPLSTPGHIGKDDPLQNPAMLNAFQDQVCVLVSANSNGSDDAGLQTKEVGPQQPLTRYQVLMQLEGILAGVLDAELLQRRLARQEISEDQLCVASAELNRLPKLNDPAVYNN